MTLAQLGALVEAENAMHAPPTPAADRGSAADLVALAGMGR